MRRRYNKYVVLHTDRGCAAYLALRELCESIVRQDDSNICLRLRRALVDRSGLLQVDGPHGLFPLLILHAQLEDAISLWQNA